MSDGEARVRFVSNIVQRMSARFTWREMCFPSSLYDLKNFGNMVYRIGLSFCVTLTKTVWGNAKSKSY